MRTPKSPNKDKAMSDDGVLLVGKVSANTRIMAKVKSQHHIARASMSTHSTRAQADDTTVDGRPRCAGVCAEVKSRHTESVVLKC